MTQVDLLRKAIGLLRKDHLMWVPYLVFFLFLETVVPFFLTTKQEVSLVHYGLFMGQLMVQYGVAGCVIFMLAEMDQPSGSLRCACDRIKQQFCAIVVGACLVSLPIAGIVYVSFSTVSGMGAQQPDVWLLCGWVLVTLYVLIPFSAAMPFSFVAFVCHKETIVESVCRTMKRCFLQYRMCLKWFWVMMSLNMVQLLFVRLSATPFVAKHVVLACVEAVLSTIIVAYSYCYYRAVFDHKERDVIPVSDTH